MQIVEATWERRNLGLAVFEVTLDKGDCRSLPSVLDRLSDSMFRGAYVTVKVPVGDLVCIHALEDLGFRFMEAQIGIRYDLTKYRTPSELRGAIVPVSIKEIPRERSAWQSIAEKISPELFETDRISLDPLFGTTVGCRRYRNWMLDLVERDDAHLLVFGDPEDENVDYGFTIDRLDERTGVLHGILGGVFADCDVPGIGISIYDASFRNDVVRGARILDSALSSNNPTVVAMDSALGIGFRRFTYVLRKLFD